MNTAPANDKNRNEVPTAVPYVVYRDAVADNRWLVKKLVFALIVAVCLMFASNIAWLIVWNSYDYETTETIVDSRDSGIANYTGGNGGINYGASDRSKDYADETQEFTGDENP